MHRFMDFMQQWGTFMECLVFRRTNLHFLTTRNWAARDNIAADPTSKTVTFPATTI